MQDYEEILTNFPFLIVFLLNLFSCLWYDETKIIFPKSLRKRFKKLKVEKDFN